MGLPRTSYFSVFSHLQLSLKVIYIYCHYIVVACSAARYCCLCPFFYSKMVTFFCERERAQFFGDM